MEFCRWSFFYKSGRKKESMIAVSSLGDGWGEGGGGGSLEKQTYYFYMEFK